MYRVTLSFLACLSICGASSPDRCKDFYEGVPFNASALEGVWRACPSPEDHRNTADVEYKYLTREEVNAFKNEAGLYFPSVSWEKVKYSRTLLNDKPQIIQNKDETVSVTLFKYLLEIDEATGSINQIPAGDVLNFLKTTNSPIPYPMLQYKMKVLRNGDFLAVISCEMRHTYIQYKPSERDAPSTEELKKIVQEVGIQELGGRGKP